MIKQLSTITLILASIFSTSAFAQVYEFQEAQFGTFSTANFGSNQGLTTSIYSAFNLISGDESLSSDSVIVTYNWSIDSATGNSFCSGECSAVQRLLNGDEIYSTFTGVTNFNGIDTITFSGTSTITGGTGLFANATGSGSYSGANQYLTENAGTSYQFVAANIITPSVSAVPEPSTYAMMGLGLLGVMWMSRRRQEEV